MADGKLYLTSKIIYRRRKGGSLTLFIYMSKCATGDSRDIKHDAKNGDEGSNPELVHFDDFGMHEARQPRLHDGAQNTAGESNERPRHVSKVDLGPGRARFLKIRHDCRVISWEKQRK